MEKKICNKCGIEALISNQGKSFCETCRVLDIKEQRSRKYFEKKEQERLELFYRDCPICGKVITYKTSNGCYKANKKNTSCLTCCKMGEKNPFYGKIHTAESMDRMKKTTLESEKRKDFWKRQQTQEFRDKLSETLKIRQPNKGKGYYKAWIRDYGLEVANQMVKEFGDRISKTAKGKRLGIPPKHGIACGNGWSGWYKEYFFRSVGELSFIINVIERFGFNAISAESQKYKVRYFIDGFERNYFPDFVLNDKYVVECKPKKLQEIPHNKIKFDAAKLKFKEDGLIFKVVDIPIIDFNLLLDLHDKDLIKFSKKTNEKFMVYVEKKKDIKSFIDKISQNITKPLT
jgi:hypothetical protein